MASRKRRTLNEDEPAPNGPADLGWTKQATAPRRSASSAPTGKNTHVAPTIPDPGIVHEPFKVLQRTDGAFIVIDTRREPGERTVEVLPVKRAREDPDADAALARVKKAAEESCILHAKQANEVKEDPHVLEERPAIDLLPPVVPATAGGEAAHA